VRGGLRHRHQPELVDEQIRGGVVQGSAALFEHCLYDERASSHGNMADYLVPMAPRCRHRGGPLVTPTADSELGAKARASGTAGAPARYERHQRRVAPARPSR